jgi:hypothetical protein
MFYPDNHHESWRTLSRRSCVLLVASKIATWPASAAAAAAATPAAAAAAAGICLQSSLYVGCAVQAQ